MFSTILPITGCDDYQSLTLMKIVGFLTKLYLLEVCWLLLRFDPKIK